MKTKDKIKKKKITIENIIFIKRQEDGKYFSSVDIHGKNKVTSEEIQKFMTKLRKQIKRFENHLNAVSQPKSEGYRDYEK